MSTRKLDYATYNLAASQNPRADIRLLPNTDGVVEIAQPQRQRPDAGGRTRDAGRVLANTEAHVPLTTELRQDDGLLCGQMYCNAPSLPQSDQINTLSDKKPPLVTVRTATGHETDSAIPWDCELGRLCKDRLETREYVLWGYAHVAALGSGKITRDELYTRCVQLGITTNRRTFNSWLQRGMDIYWRERGGYLYLTSYKKLSARHTKNAAKYHPDWVATNLPGQQRVLLDLTGSLQSVHAALYGGWITVKAAKNGYLDISRFTLCALWNSSKRALLGYEKLLGIRVEERYAESADIHNPLIPAHATLHIDKDGHEFASWCLSNRYFSPDISIHPCNGQRRKIRAACHDTVDSTAPANKRAGGRLRVHRTGKLYFEDRVTSKGIALGHKRLHKHLAKHEDAGLRPHYAYMIRRYGKHIYECSTGDRLRSDQVERDVRAERTGAFELRAMQYRIGWQGRGV